MLVPHQGVQPAIGGAAVAEIIDQLGMAFVDAEFGQVDRHSMVTRQVAEKPAAAGRAIGVEGVDPDR